GRGVRGMGGGVLGGWVPCGGWVSPERQLILDAYRPVDVAFKVVGTGSVGSRDFVVLAFGIGPHDPLVLQVKEEFRSAWAPYVREDATHDGVRVAGGPRGRQTWSAPPVHWARIGV